MGLGYLAIRSYTRSSYANRAQNLFVLLQAGDYDKAEGEFLNRGFCKTLEDRVLSSGVKSRGLLLVFYAMNLPLTGARASVATSLRLPNDI